MKNILILLVLCLSSFSGVQTQNNSEESSEWSISRLKLKVANAYLLQYGDKILLFDTGEWGREELLEKKLRKAGVNPCDLDVVIVSHGHADHAGGTAHLVNRCQVPVVAARAESQLLQRGHNPALIATSSLGEWVDKHIVKVDSFPPIVADVWVGYALDLNSYGFPAQVRVLPGHTEGSLVLVADEFALVGDLIRGGMIAGHQPRTHFFHEDREMAESHLEGLLGQGIRTFYPGHFGSLKAKRVRKYLTKHRTL